MKKEFIGIDVSKEKLDVSVLFFKNEYESCISNDYNTFSNTPCGFRSMVSWTKRVTESRETDTMLFCDETTGSYDIRMCDYLYAHGIDIWREGALQIKLSGGLRRGKDDRGDSMMIADYAMRHADKAVTYKPLDPKVRNLKTLFLYRKSLVERKTALAVRAKEIKATASKGDDAVDFIYRDSMKEVVRIEKSIAECNNKMKEVINSDHELKKNYAHVTSISGVSVVNGTALLVYTDNFRNFKSANKLATYYGVAAFRSKSGTSINRREDVRRYSSRMLKAYISEAAISAITHRGVLKDYYDRLVKEGKSKPIAMNNVKNKILHIAFSLVRHDCDFEENHEIVRIGERKGIA